MEDNEQEINSYLKGRGAQINTKKPLPENTNVRDHIEGIDDWSEPNSATQYLIETAKGIVNKVDSPDVGMMHSMNLIPGCEHGCIYCYAQTLLNIGAIVQDWISKERSSLKRTHLNYLRNF